ncbi:hypothetical protein ABT215_04085 [Streptomyces sp900105755]|uniref:hypothetical protein n=1 Tax=Streptomyces sp. 900105755 TaxID=3154389 RepID=UPI00332BF5FB
MSKQFKILKPGDYFIARNAGVQTVPEARCEHGQAALFLVLFGRRRSQTENADQRLHVLMPRCVMAEAIGALQAQILHAEGESALQEFLDEIATHAADSTKDIEQLHAQGRDCCEAGFRTNGSEHTCGRNEAGQ